MTANANPSFDPRIADWLEEGPDDAPAAVLDTVLAATPSIPQRRGVPTPWRSSSMSIRSGQLVAATLVVAVVAVVAVFALLRAPDVGGPGPTRTNGTQTFSPTGRPASSSPVAPSARPAAALPEGDIHGIGPWESTSFDIPMTFQTPATGWHVAMDTPGSVVLVSQDSTIQFIHVLAGARTCTEADLWAPWQAGDPASAPDVLRGAPDGPFSSDPAHAFIDYVRYRLEPFSSPSPNAGIGIGPDEPISVGGREAIWTEIMDDLGAKAMATCPNSLIPIAKFASDNWFGLDTVQHGAAAGSYWIGAVSGNSTSTSTLVVVVQPPPSAGAPLDKNRLATAEAVADIILSTITFP